MSILGSKMFNHGVGVKQSHIKSIQRGSVDSSLITSSGYSIAISSVDMSKSIVRIVFRAAGSSTAPSYNLYGAQLMSSTSITLYFAEASAKSGYTVYWEVIEFNNVKSLQRGTTIAPTGSTNYPITISSVDMAKSIVFNSYTSADGSVNYRGEIIKGAILANSTTISIIRYDSNGASTHYWQVIEFI